jgi:hypothetical protein
MGTPLMLLSRAYVSALRRVHVCTREPPAFLLLGNDALSTYRRLAAARLGSIEAWEYLTTSTDIDA